MNATGLLLCVRDLAVVRRDAAGESATPLVEGISFDLERGRVLALVGPCGGGKTLTALAIARLLPPGLRQVRGRVLFEGIDLARVAEPELRALRRNGMALIFQEPLGALSPVHTVGEQLTSALFATGAVQSAPFGARRRARARASELLARVDLPDPEQLLDSHPHQLSAGMRRRLMIALALAGEPRLLIADEPTAGLDATIQSQIIDLQPGWTLAHLVVQVSDGVSSQSDAGEVGNRETRPQLADSAGRRSWEAKALSGNWLQISVHTITVDPIAER